MLNLAFQKFGKTFFQSPYSKAEENVPGLFSVYCSYYFQVVFIDLDGCSKYLDTFTEADLSLPPITMGFFVSQRLLAILFG